MEILTSHASIDVNIRNNEGLRPIDYCGNHPLIQKILELQIFKTKINVTEDSFIDEPNPFPGRYRNRSVQYQIASSGRSDSGRSAGEVSRRDAVDKGTDELLRDLRLLGVNV